MLADESMIRLNLKFTSLAFYLSGDQFLTQIHERVQTAQS
jgi:hypothetical protein